MATTFSSLRRAFAGISPRERRLLLALSAALGVAFLVGIYAWSSSALDDIETERAATVDALRAIRNERPRIRQREAARDRMLSRYLTRAPALTSFVESVARDPNAPPPEDPDAGTPTTAQPVGAAATGTPPAAGSAASQSAAHDGSVTVAEATDRTSPPSEGRRFQRRVVAIRLRQVNLQSLVGFMDRIDSAQFPVAVTSIRIRKRFGESNSYDVDDMAIATWDRLAAAPTRGRAGASGTGTDSTGSSSRGTTDDSNRAGGSRP